MTMDIVTSREPINSYKRRTSQRSYVNVHIIKEPYTKLFLSIISKKKQQQSINSRQVHGVLKKRCQTAYIVSFIKDSYNTLFVSQKKIQQSMNSWHLKENYDNVHIIKDSYTRILSLCKLKNKALLTQVHAIFNPLHSFFFQIFNEVLQYLNVQETCKKD